MKKKLYLLIYFIFAFVCGCDYYSPFKEIIFNNTTDTIFITYIPYLNRVDTFVCYPNTETIFREYDIPEIEPGNYECPCGNGSWISEDRITIKLSSNRILKKSFFKLENWNCKVISDTLKQYFIINEEDLE